MRPAEAGVRRGQCAALLGHRWMCTPVCLGSGGRWETVNHRSA